VGGVKFICIGTIVAVVVTALASESVLIVQVFFDASIRLLVDQRIFQILDELAIFNRHILHVYLLAIRHTL